MLPSRNIAGFTRLLEHGANPNLVESDQGYSVMYVLVIGDLPEMLEIALEHGGNPNLVFIQQKTPMLMVAAKKKRFVNAMLLIDAGADINGQDVNGSTVLDKATLFNQFDLVLKLLELGADYTITDRWGKRFTFMLKRKIDKNLVDPSSKQYADMQKVVAFLEARGVEIE